MASFEADDVAIVGKLVRSSKNSSVPLRLAGQTMKFSPRPGGSLALDPRRFSSSNRQHRKLLSDARRHGEVRLPVVLAAPPTVAGTDGRRGTISGIDYQRSAYDRPPSEFHELQA